MTVINYNCPDCGHEIENIPLEDEFEENMTHDDYNQSCSADGCSCGP